VAPSKESPASQSPVQLKDPLIAGVLAWLIPGLGHFYQGRKAKGALFSICIMGTFLYGLYLGGSSQPAGGSKQVGWGRAVYFNFDEKEWRLPWLCQVGVGFPTLPMTLLQWKLRDNPVLDGFMAPPSSDGDQPNNPSLATIQRRLSHYFELGTVYTMIAGLLNILAVYDACCGPVISDSDKNKKDKEPDKAEQDGGEKKS